MGEVIDCESLAQYIKDSVKNEIFNLNIKPKLTVLTNPDDEASKVYVKNKKEACKYCDIDFEEIELSDKTDFEKLHDVLVNDDNPLIVQLPVHNSMHEEAMEILIDELVCERDVDGFSKDSLVIPATAKGVMEIFDYIDYDLTGKHVGIIGRGKTCAKPLVNLMLAENATVTSCNSYTKDLKDITKTCDVVISCVGKPHMITEDFIKEGAVVINVGLSRNDKGKLCGDVDFKNVKNKASYITKNVGGVGLLTVACLMENVLALTKTNLLYENFVEINEEVQNEE